MTENNYTPGPWSVGERKARGWSDQADYFVCTGNPDEDSPELICRPYATNGYDGIAERNANARLIAAAPDLLEALDWALSELRGKTRYDNPQQALNCFEKADAAIRKATEA